MNYKRQALFNTIGVITSLVSQWLIIVLMPNFGGFAEAGVLSIAISIGSIFNTIASFNSRQYQVTDSYDEFTEDNYISFRIHTIFLSIVLCLFYLEIFHYTKNEFLAILFYLLYRNLLQLSDVYIATLQIKQRLDLVGIGCAIEGIVSIISFFCLYVNSKNIIISLLGMACISGGVFFIFIFFCYTKVTGKHPVVKTLPIATSIPILKKTFPLLLSIIFPIILTAIPKILLQEYCGNRVVGIFSSLSAPTVIITTVATSVFAPFILLFSGFTKSSNFESIEKKLKQIMLISALGSVIVVLFSFLFGKYFFELLYGKEVLQYIVIFYQLIIAMCFNAICSLTSSVLISMHRNNFLAITSFITLAFGCLFIALNVHKYGVYSASFGLMITYLFQAILQFSYILYCCRINKSCKGIRR